MTSNRRRSYRVMRERFLHSWQGAKLSFQHDSLSQKGAEGFANRKYRGFDQIAGVGPRILPFNRGSPRLRTINQSYAHVNTIPKLQSVVKRDVPNSNFTDVVPAAFFITARTL